MKKNIYFYCRICLYVLLLSILISAISSTRAFAEGTGAGSQSNSPGTPGQKPLSLVSATLVGGGTGVNGAQSVPLNLQIEFTFDKNVVNSVIWENNSKCFTMNDSQGKNIPIIVSKIDDTVDPSKKQMIFVKPVSNLLPGARYTIKVSPNLTAKNGVTLGESADGKSITVAFKTAGQAVQPSSSGTAPSQARSDSNTAANQDKSGSGAVSSGASNFYVNLAVYTGLALVICWIAIEIFNARRKNKI